MPSNQEVFGLGMHVITQATMVTSGAVWGYLDPGSGGILLQVLLGGVAAVGVLLKLYWNRVRAIFGGAKPPSGPMEKEPP